MHYVVSKISVQESKQSLAFAGGFVKQQKDCFHYWIGLLSLEKYSESYLSATAGIHIWR